MVEHKTFEKVTKIKVLQYVSDSIARFCYAPLDPTGKIMINNQVWDVTKSVPDYLITKKRGKGSKEPFFILRNDYPMPIDIKIDEQQVVTPSSLNQLINNENLKALTKIGPVEVDYKKMFLGMFIMFFVGFGISFMLSMFGLL